MPPSAGHVRAFGSDASRPKRSEGPRLRRARSRLAVVADPHAFVLLSLDLEQLGCLDQVAQLPVTVVASVEGRLVADLVAHLCELCPDIVAVRCIHDIAQHLHEAGVAA